VEKGGTRSEKKKGNVEPTKRKKKIFNRKRSHNFVGIKKKGMKRRFVTTDSGEGKGLGRTPKTIKTTLTFSRGPGHKEYTGAVVRRKTKIGGQKKKSYRDQIGFRQKRNEKKKNFVEEKRRGKRTGKTRCAGLQEKRKADIGPHRERKTQTQAWTAVHRGGANAKQFYDKKKGRRGGAKKSIEQTVKKAVDVRQDNSSWSATERAIVTDASTRFQKRGKKGRFETDAFSGRGGSPLTPN